MTRIVIKIKAAPVCTEVHEVSLLSLEGSEIMGRKQAETGGVTEICLASQCEMVSFPMHLLLSLTPMNLRKEGLKQKFGQVEFSSFGCQTRVKEKNEKLITFFISRNILICT